MSRLLKKGLEIYSPTGEEKNVAEFFFNEMAKIGFESKIDEVGNVIGTIGGKADGKLCRDVTSCGKTILLLGHIDTVKGFIDVREENGRLFGRGSVDAKGSFCAFIEAVSRLKDLKTRFVVIGVVGEEGDSRGARYVLGKYKPDYIIIGEPSGWDGITIGYKGRLKAKFVVCKEKCHSSIGEGAGQEGVIIFNEIKKYCDEFNLNKKMFEQLNYNLDYFNTSDDGFKQEAKLCIGFRMPVIFDIPKFKCFLNSLFCGVEFFGDEMPIKAEKNNSLVRAFLKAIRKNYGAPKFKLKNGTSDMNILGHTYNVPIVAYGPGDSSLDHTPNEHIEIEEYEKSIEVLVCVLEEL